MLHFMVNNAHCQSNKTFVIAIKVICQIINTNSNKNFIYSFNFEMNIIFLF